MKKKEISISLHSREMPQSDATRDPGPAGPHSRTRCRADKALPPLLARPAVEKILETHPESLLSGPSSGRARARARSSNSFKHSPRWSHDKLLPKPSRATLTKTGTEVEPRGIDVGVRWRRGGRVFREGAGEETESHLWDNDALRGPRSSLSPFKDLSARERRTRSRERDDTSQLAAAHHSTGTGDCGPLSRVR